MEKTLLLGSKGCGNAIVESALALAGVPFDCEEVDYSPGSTTRERLLSVNPLGQVPALGAARRHGAHREPRDAALRG